MSSVIVPSASLVAKLRAHHSRALAMRGVPRLRRASSRAASSVIVVFSLRALMRDDLRPAPRRV